MAADYGRRSVIAYYHYFSTESDLRLGYRGITLIDFRFVRFIKIWNYSKKGRKKHEEEKIGEGYKSRQVEKFETYGEDKTLTLDKYQLKNTTSKFCESPAKTAKSDLKLSLRLTSSAYWTQVLW